MARFVSPEEIAAAIVFLGVENAGFITGQTLFVDGDRALECSDKYGAAGKQRWASEFRR
jgi:NAD(P)-dependent dehydrogenase (short-subunit alcohol dehydrogenase family)